MLGGQSSLLKYWEFDPSEEEIKDRRDDGKSSESSDRTKVEHEMPSPKPKRKWGFRRGKKEKLLENDMLEKGPAKPAKKMPVIFFDEAHKL